MPRLKKNELDNDEGQKDAYDIVMEGIQKECSIPGCRPKFHLDEARAIVEELRRYNLLKD
jgi:hypothetical protein